MRPFDYCPACRAELGRRDGEGGATCPNCGRVWYRNSAPTVGAALVRDGRALVTRRGIEPEKDRFDVPGGFLAAGEDPIEGLRREIREELGVDIDVTVEDCLSMVPHTYGPEGDYVLALGFKARLRSGEPQADEAEVAEIRWVTEDEVDDLDFAWEHDRELVRRALKDG